LPGLPGTPAPAAKAAPADLQALIATLEDQAARDQLVARLKALAEAGPDKTGTETFATVLEEFGDAFDDRVDTIGDAFVELIVSVRQVPILTRWLWLQLSEPISRELWWSIGRQTGTAVLAGFFASLLVRLLLRGWRDRLSALPLAARRKAKLKASLAHLAVNLLALGVFLAITYAVLAYGDVSLLARRIAGDVLVAIACVRGLTALSSALLAAENPRRRLVDLDDALAVRVQRWLSLLLGLSFYGYFALNAARRLGLPWTVHGFLLHILSAVVAGLLITVIYRLRGHVGAAIEHWGQNSTSVFARYLPWQALAAAGHHLLAIWVGLVFLVWTLDIPDGALILTRGMAVTVLALFALRAFHVWLDRTIVPERATAGDPSAEPSGEVEAEPEAPRPSFYVAAVTVLRLAAILLAASLVLQAWGLNIAGWLQTPTGREVLASLGQIGAIVAVVAIAAKAIQIVAARYVEARDVNGNLLYSNRARTLVSMARNLGLTLLIAIGTIEVLSEIGVNANALLAGAGVVGLALGFGSQRLVQDLITGLFILVGDTVRVGDVVDLGGKAGVVEAISMRTITLRDYNGNVHTIPYSSINIVTNMTKDFSFAVFDIGVAFREDIDRVMDVLRELESQLRREWPYRRLIQEPLEIAGVDGFRDSAVIIKARFKVRAGEQWKVGREFNRRIKKRFDELGIEIPFPHQTVYFGRDKEDGGPPAEIERLRRDVLANPIPARRAAGDA
jgi:small conductance mechanosensitive channel